MMAGVLRRMSNDQPTNESVLLMRQHPRIFVIDLSACPTQLKFEAFITMIVTIKWEALPLVGLKRDADKR